MAERFGNILMRLMYFKSQKKELEGICILDCYVWCSLMRYMDDSVGIE